MGSEMCIRDRSSVFNDFDCNQFVFVLLPLEMGTEKIAEFMLLICSLRIGELSCQIVVSLLY